MKCRPEFWIRFRSWSRCTCSISLSTFGLALSAFDEETQQQIRTPLRLLYAAGGLIALIEFGLCCLQNSMFTRTADETGVTIVQNYSIDALPFLSYDLLSVLSAVLTALLVGLLVFIFIWMRRKSR